MKEISAVILAAGEGKRMKSRIPKVLHPICGRPLLGHVLSAVAGLCGQTVVVVGHGAEQITETFGRTLEYALQKEQLGTGHAVMQAAGLFSGSRHALVLCGDVPLLPRETLAAFIDIHLQSNRSATVLTAMVPDPRGYGRIIREKAGSVQKIAEERDATAEQKEIREINTGTYLFQTKDLLSVLEKLNNNNDQGEYYLTDCIELLSLMGRAAGSYMLEDHRLALGVNDRIQLSLAEELMRERINNRLLESGVSMPDPRSVYVDADVSVGRDTVLLPQSYLKGRTKIGEGCVIGPGTEISDSTVGDLCTIRHSVLDQCHVENQAVVGPYAHLRPQTRLRRAVKIGNFVEVKNSDIGDGTKISHLSYVGDADVGRQVNLGAGSIVVNYDGREKHRTTIDDRAFIGCNSNLVAPLAVGRGAFVAAGSTITRDVPSGSLSLARSRQVNKEGLAARFLDINHES